MTPDRVAHDPAAAIPPALGPPARACFGSPPLDAAALARVEPCLRLLARMIADREPYLAGSGADLQVFGTHWGGRFLSTAAAMVARAEPAILDRLRLIYVFTGFPIAPWRRPALFPAIDPAFHRYMKLRVLTPPRLRFAAPALCGEAGLRVDGGLFNHDVALVQERLQFLLFGGAMDWLAGQTDPVVMEIGSGAGLNALALHRAFPAARVILCDVPESLSLAFAYLHLVAPDAAHFLATTEGFIPTGRPADRIATATALPAGFVYIPNYLMHRYAEGIAVHLVMNAMSLHEMRAAQIAYYAGFMARATAATDGLFFDVSAHAGEDNPTLMPVLRSVFAYVRRLPFIDLGLGGKLWTNARATFDALDRAARRRADGLDLDAAFRLDDWYLYPPFDADAALAVIDEDLGRLLGFDFAAWMASRGYTFAQHLEGHRQRHRLV